MASTQIVIPANTWTNLSNDTAGGTIRMLNGRRPLQLTQQAAAPTGTAAISAELTPTEEFATYYGLPTGENVWAYSRDYATTVVVTPAD